MPARRAGPTRSVAAAASVLGGGRSFGSEGMTTAAGGHRIRVLDAEAAAHQVVVVIDRHARQVADRERVDDDVHILEGEAPICLARGTLERHAILHPGAAAAGYEHPQRVALQIALLDQPPHAADRGLGERDLFFDYLFLNVHVTSPLRDRLIPSVSGPESINLGASCQNSSGWIATMQAGSFSTIRPTISTRVESSPSRRARSNWQMIGQPSASSR